jgi:hypothetical protein
MSFGFACLARQQTLVGETSPCHAKATAADVQPCGISPPREALKPVTA